MIQGRDLLLYLSYKYSGDWERIFEAIKKREAVDMELLQECKNLIKCNFITIIDENYPQCYKQIFQPPFVLYYYGDINLLDNYYSNLAVVGSREALKENKQLTKEIIKNLNNEFVIVSGLAHGIDSIAHEAIIKNNGKTIAVLGCGIDYIYPKENEDLYNIIKKDHLLISEYPNLTPPKNDYFPFRNRLVCGLAPLLFVPEVKLKSGTNISIKLAIEQGKDILILPQSPNNGTINNRIIKDGAILVESAQDILNEKK